MARMEGGNDNDLLTCTSCTICKFVNLSFCNVNQNDQMHKC